MNKVRFFLIFFCMLFLVQGLYAQKWEPEDTVELMNEIRRDKFDNILPQVMRDNNIDMWIHVIRPWTPDPLAYEFGSNSGVFIFTDSGGDRIGRAVFDSEVQDPGAYDIIGGEANALNLQDYLPEDPEEAPETEMDYRFNSVALRYEGSTRIFSSPNKGLGEFVAERDPKRIGVNYSERLSLAEGSEVRALTDGISYTDHLQLVKALGDKYAKRMVSAEYLIIDYLSRRVMKEIELHKLMGMRANEYLDREFAKIVSGVTTVREISHAAILRHPDGTRVSREHVFQGGDLLSILHGAGDMRRIMDADVAGHGYVLREGETTLPPEVQKIWEHGVKVRKILENNIKVGPTAGETLEILIRKLEEAGYVYIDRQRYDKNADPEKTQVHLDLHAAGKGMLAPRISSKGPKWQRDMKIPLNHTFTFEYMIYMPVPEWGRGKHLYLQFHDGVMVTERGVEYPYPPSQGIRIIK